MINKLKKIFINQKTSHSFFDDFQGLLTGLCLLALSVVFYKNAGLYSGGVAGLSLAASYIIGWPVGLLFFLISCPFFVLSFFRMGKQLTIKTLFVVILLSLFITLFSQQLTILYINPFFAACVAGLLSGTALIQLFRHKASAGGINIVALYAQDKFGWNVGLTQLVLDGLIVMLSLLSGSLSVIIASLIAMVFTNFAIAINHRKGRYFSF